MPHKTVRSSRLVQEKRVEKALRDCPTPILNAENCIQQALAQWGSEVYVSWSGGRCSTVVLHMALQIEPKINVVFNDTGIEFPETYAFIKQLTKDWNLNLTTLKPKVNFFKDIVPKYGFPMLRGQYKQDSISKDGKPMCCQLLKEAPLLHSGIQCTITGIRASESRMRMFAIAQFGQYYKAKTLKRWQYHPIAFWSTEELMQYVTEHKLPMNKVYSMGHDRCGCWPCTGYIGWRENLARSHPKLHRFLVSQKGEPTLWEYIEPEEGCRQFLQE